MVKTLVFHKIKSIKENNHFGLTIFDFILIFIYIFLSSFETYFLPFFGNITKFIMIGIIATYFIKDLLVKHFKIDSSSICLLLWFALKLLSIFIGKFNEIVELHYLSQFGFVFFIIPFLTHDYGKKEKRLILLAFWLVSFLFNFLTIMFSKAYLTVYVSRRVLTLFGQQNDPNNCAAISIIGVSISLYVLLCKKKYFIANSVAILIGSIAIIISGSRTGLLALIVVLLVSLYFRKRLSVVEFCIQSIVILCVGAIAVIILSYTLPIETFKRLFANFDDGSDRVKLWQQAFKLFMSSPFLGTGWGTATWYGKYFPTAVHNTFLSMLAENGIVGLCLFIIPWFIIFKKAVKERNLLPVLILLSAFISALFIDSINKRFIWNSIITASLSLGLSDVSFNKKNQFFVYREINI